MKNKKNKLYNNNNKFNINNNNLLLYKITIFLMKLLYKEICLIFHMLLVQVDLVKYGKQNIKKMVKFMQ